MKKNKLNNRKEGTMLTLQHVTINTKNLERSMEFYEEVFGFTRAERPNFDFDGAWYWIEEGKTALHLQINPQHYNTNVSFAPVDHIALDASNPTANTTNEQIIKEYERWKSIITGYDVQTKWLMDFELRSFDPKKFLQIFLTEPLNNVRWELNFPMKKREEEWR